MTRRHLQWVIICFAMSLGVVALLVAASKDLRQRPGSFLRMFPPHPVLEKQTLDIGHSSYYVAGGTPHTVYLGDYTSPLHVLAINLISLDTQHIRLNAEGIFDEKYWSLRVQVDSPYFYLYDGAVPRIFRGKVGEWYGHTSPKDNVYFTEMVPVGTAYYITKSIVNPEHEYQLCLVHQNPIGLEIKRDLLKKQVDGIFCKEGRISFNQEHGIVTYVYRYRNEFLIMDTLLNVLQISHTLDTNFHSKIKVDTIQSSNRYTFSAPPFSINKFSFSAGNDLFILSSLLAKNEHKNMHKKASVIDVYNTLTGDYRFSFYIFHHQNKHITREFAVFGDHLLALQGKYIQFMSLSHDYFILNSNI